MAVPLIPTIISSLFAFMFVIAPCFVRKGPNQPITQSCIMMAAFWMWIFYITVYIAQMNPLIGPRLSKEQIIWLAMKCGDPIETKKAT